MAKGTRRSTKRRAIAPSDRTLRSMARERAPSSDDTARSLMPRTNLMSLPNETLVFIAQYCEEKELWALCLASRRLNNVATSILWKGLYNNPWRCKEVLLWAVDVGRNDLVEDLLNRKVSPNFLYFSSLLGSRLRNVLEAQGRRGAVGPRDDRRLHEEIFREKYCRSRAVRNRVRHARRKAKLSLRITEEPEDMDWNLAHAWFEHTCSLRHFGISEGPEVNDRQYWYWAPIHVAAMRGNNTALRMLLDSQADVNVQCSGLCDCAAPTMDGEDDLEMSITPTRNRSVWTALHVAMCSGNEEGVRLLLSRGASISVGSLIRQPYTPHHKSRLAINVFQDAAWLGSVAMCRVLVNEPKSQPFISSCNSRSQTALHYSAAAGSIRTVGKFLLRNGATFYFYDDDRDYAVRFDPLRQLCAMGNFEDARWLLNFCRKLWPGRRPRNLYTRALAALCSLRPGPVFSRLSLRQQQDRWYELTPERLKEMKAARQQAVGHSKRQRVLLAGRLLSLGADPNGVEMICYGALPSVLLPRRHYQAGDHFRTPLQLAAMCSFTEMAKLLVSKGADTEKIATRPGHWASLSKPLEELPLMIAVDNALSRASNNKRDLGLVQALLKAGCSVADRGNQCVLLTLQLIKARFAPVPPAVQECWLSIMKEVLKHGAAAATTGEDWERIVLTACMPGNLAYCKMLEAARPIRGFGFYTHVEMVRQAIFGGSTRGREDATENLELVCWALRQCLTREGRVIRLRFQGAFYTLAGDARNAGKNDVADVVEDFALDMPIPPEERQASPELGLQSSSASEMELLESS